MTTISKPCLLLVKNLVLCLLVLVAFLSASASADDRNIVVKKKPPVEIESRVALVVGNSQYKDSPLKNPANDALDISAALNEAGFDVITRIDADRVEMRKALRLFGDRLKKSSVGLFFYAGHGFQVDGENYLVPIDADVSYEDEIPDECIKISSVLHKMESANNKTNLIFLDACRNNPFVSRYRSARGGLAEMDAPIGSLLVYSTAPGAVAADGDGRNGLFTSRLLQHIPTSGASINQVLMKVRVDVMQSSNNRQVPWESSSLTSDFYFFPDGSTPQDISRPQIVVTSPLKNSSSAQDCLLFAQESSSYEEKINYLKRAVSLEPNLYEGHIRLAQNYAKKKEYQLALEHYERCLLISENNTTHYELGRIYRILGNDDKARDHLRLAASESNYIGKQASRMLSLME